MQYEAKKAFEETCLYSRSILMMTENWLLEKRHDFHSLQVHFLHTLSSRLMSCGHYGHQFQQKSIDFINISSSLCTVELMQRRICSAWPLIKYSDVHRIWLRLPSGLRVSPSSKVLSFQWRWKISHLHRSIVCSKADIVWKAYRVDIS